MTETTITIDVLRGNKKYTLHIRKEYENNTFYVENDDMEVVKEGLTSLIRALDWAADVMGATDIMPVF